MTSQNKEIRVDGLAVEADPDHTTSREVMNTLFELASYHNIIALDATMAFLQYHTLTLALLAVSATIHRPIPAEWVRGPFPAGRRADAYGSWRWRRIPAAEAAVEDDGWVFSYVYDGTRDTSELVILDASDVTAAPVATITLPQRIPFGFHGSWISDAHLGQR